MISTLLTLCALFVQPSSLEQKIAAVLEGRAPPETLDYGAIRFSDGLAALDEIERSTNLRFLPDGGGGTPFSPTDVNCRWIAIHEGIEAARLAPSHEAYAQSRVRAEALVLERVWQADVAAADARDGSTASIADLLAASARDRVWTALWYDQPRRTPEQRFDFEMVEAFAARPRCEARQAAIAALDALLSEERWAELNADDEALSGAIALTVQHAGGRRDLRTQSLAWLEAGLEDGNPRAAHRYALVADRLAAIDGAPQPYGTQGFCEAGMWRRLPMLNPAAAEAFRARYALPSLDAHEAAMQAACG